MTKPQPIFPEVSCATESRIYFVNHDSKYRILQKEGHFDIAIQDFEVHSAQFSLHHTSKLQHTTATYHHNSIKISLPT